MIIKNEIQLLFINKLTLQEKLNVTDSISSSLDI